VAQLVYTLVTLVPGIIVYHNFYLNIAFLATVLMGCIWNGASFYIEVFAERYRLKFASDEDVTSAANVSRFDPDTLPEEEEEEQVEGTLKKKGD
jgi:hypothetical protein